MYNFLTKTIAKTVGIFAPETAKNYLRQHLGLRAYEGAKVSGINRNFKPQQSSGAQEIQESWQEITNRTRALARDNAHVAGMIKRFVEGLVGEGAWPRPKILKTIKSGKFDFNIELNNEILRRWENWAPTACANGDSVYQLQRLCAYTYFVDGEILVRWVIKNRQLMLEPIEVDRLDTSKDTDTDKLRIVGGKELDEYNKPVAYWIKSRFPTERDIPSIRVPAEQIIDLYDRDRASSVGGISRLAPSVLNFHNIGKFRADTMSLARTGLGFGVFVETEYPEDFFGVGSEGEDEHGREYDYVTPGGVHYMRPGEKISTVRPETPTAQYEPFLRAELRSASVGAGMSYESVSNDGSQSSYSSTRQMLLFERAMFRYTFAIFEEKLYNAIYKWFLEFEMSFGKPPLPLAGYKEDPMFYRVCTWSRPRVEWVDPLKDAKAAKEEVSMGVSTLTEFCEIQGRDIEEVVATRKYENELFKSAGIEPDLKVGGRYTSGQTETGTAGDAK